jgi:hypothetical protein
VRRWIVVGLLSDLFDIAAAASSARSIGKRGALIAALVPLPVVGADIRALQLLGT